MNTNLHFSSKTDNWATPKDFFDKLNEEFRFTLDACADSSNAKVADYFTKEIDGLSQSWSGTVWVNPPYGREISKWIKKSYEESILGSTVVMLIPARTDTVAWHSFIFGKTNVEIRFIKGRLKFGECKNPAPFPSAVVIFKEIPNLNQNK